MAVSADEVKDLRRAWTTFLDSNSAAPSTRPEIVASWRRSQLSRVSVDRLDLPFTPGAMADSKLLLAAAPVLDEFAVGLSGSPVSVVLADRAGRVVGRWSGERALERQLEAESISLGFVLTEEHAGTNGIGTALEMMRPVKVYGPEHYAQSLHGLTCAAAPLRNPLSHQIEGVVNLACPNAEVNALLLPTVVDLARRIGREMHARSTHREQAVLEAFLLANRTTRGAIVAIGETFFMANAAAAPLLDGAEQTALWRQVPEGLSEGAVSGEIQLDRGTMRATFRGVVVGGRTVGSVIELDTVPSARRRADPGARDDAAARLRAAGLVGCSPAWHHVCVSAVRVRSDRPVIILGESGVGKRALAEFLHRDRRQGELRLLPAGLEQVHGRRRWLLSLHEALADPRTGTVVITQAQDLTPECVRGVTELVETTADPPFVVATVTTDPDSAVSTAAAPTLQDRLDAPQVLVVPPLRERPADVQVIANHVLSDAQSAAGVGRLSADALTALSRYRWPGNIRELRTVVRETLEQRRGTVLTSVDLPAALRDAGPAPRLSRMETVERDAIRQALLEAGGNKSAAAVALGISRKTLHRRIQRYRLDDNGGF